MARIEREFFKLVDLAVVAAKVQLSPEIVDFVYRYWILKRRAGNNKPLLPPRGDDESLSGLKAEDTERDKMKMLVGIRQVSHHALGIVFGCHCLRFIKLMSNRCSVMC